MTAQIEMFDIDNPCVDVCRVNKKGYCFGCLRSREERQLWFKMTNQQRREVLRLIGGRRARLEAMRRRRREQLTLDFSEDNTQSLF